MKSEEKTNVMRLLESKKIAYTAHTYAADPSLSGEEIAGILGEDPAVVFKTLVTRGKTGRNYVFVIPGRKIRGNDPAEGTAAADRLRSRRVFSCRNEKTVSDFCTCVSRIGRTDLCQRRKSRVPD